MAAHKRPKKVGKFCAKTGKPCSCGNNYRTVCDPGWKYQAHHVLCVAAVNQIMSYGGEGIKAILRETQWCINASPNMYAMPVWGSTVKHYVKVARINALVAHASLAPPFAGIPQHNVDHNITDGYLDEVKTRLKELKQDLLSKKHEVALKNIKGQLNGASRSFKSILRGRGRRRGGTHSAWNKAVKGRDTQWYLPFSMASTSIAKPMAFPKNLSDSDRGWIDKIRKLISNR